MKNRIRFDKIVAVLLMVVMFVGLFPMTALAAYVDESIELVEYEPEVFVEPEEYEEVADALPEEDEDQADNEQQEGYYPQDDADDIDSDMPVYYENETEGFYALDLDFEILSTQLFLENQIESTSSENVMRHPRDGGSFMMEGFPTPFAFGLRTIDPFVQSVATYDITGRGVTELRGTFARQIGNQGMPSLVVIADGRLVEGFTLWPGMHFHQIQVRIPAGTRILEVRMVSNGGGTLGFGNAYFSTATSTLPDNFIRPELRRSLFLESDIFSTSSSGMYSFPYNTSFIMQGQPYYHGWTMTGTGVGHRYAVYNIGETGMTNTGRTTTLQGWFGRIGGNAGTGELRIYGDGFLLGAHTLPSGFSAPGQIWISQNIPAGTREVRIQMQSIGAGVLAFADAHFYGTPPEQLVWEFVARLYREILGREPDAEGHAFWVGRLLSGRALAADLASRFVFSQEFRNKNLSNSEFVEVLYRAFLGRPSDPEGMAHWVSRLYSGRSRPDVFASFANSTEFRNISYHYGIRHERFTPPPRLAVEEFVVRLYAHTLFRAPDARGLAFWTDHLVSGRRTATEVARSFIFSNEMNNQHLTNRQFIERLYIAFLGRPADDSGLEFWLNRMNVHDWSRAEIFNSFARSSEFGRIATQHGLRR